MESTLPPELADLFAGYRLEKLVGSGGAGKVYLATQLETGQRVAVKIFHAHRTAKPEFARRFDREVALSRELDHPGVVRLLDKLTGRDDKTVGLVMEFVEGHTLRPLLKQGPLPPKVALDLAARIADVLAYVHRKGVAHLDLKPENVLVVDVSNVRLMDFGISQGTHGQLARDGMKTQNISGTPHYMAPEQFSGDAPLDHRADLYSLGVMLHEMLTGERPIGGFLAMGGRFNIWIQQEAEGIVNKLLQTDPAARYQIAADVADRVRQLARKLEDPDAARPRSPPPPAPRVQPVSRPEATRPRPAAPPPQPPKPKAGRTDLGAIWRAVSELASMHYWVIVALMFFALMAGFYWLVDFAFTH